MGATSFFSLSLSLSFSFPHSSSSFFKIRSASGADDGYCS